MNIPVLINVLYIYLASAVRIGCPNDTDECYRVVHAHCVVQSLKISSLVNDPVLPSNIVR